MRVLHLLDKQITHDGISNFARMTTVGLRRAGLDVDEWDVHYPSIYARREAGEPTYTPRNVLNYDVVYIGWHPIVMNTFLPEHFYWPKGTGPLVAVYLNDIPPWSGCPYMERAESVIAAEPTPAANHLMVYPIPDWVTDLPEPDPEFTVGWSGVRGDGAAELRGVCEQHGWAMNMTQAPSERTAPWVSVEDEIRRLARSTVNVCWYSQQRGIAGTPSVALGSRRPLLLNDSKMFAPWWDLRYANELYTSHLTLERALCLLHEGWANNLLALPGPNVYADHSWTTAARNLVAHWTKTLEAR